MWSGAAPTRSVGQLRRISSWLWPMPPLVTTTAGARCSKSPAGSRLDFTPRSESSSASTVPRTPTTRPSSTTSSSTWWRKREAYEPCCLRLLDRLGEDADDLGTGAPGEVEARHRVAVAGGAAVAALGPADEGQRPQAEGAEVVALLLVGEPDVRLGPLPRPEVLAATGTVGAVAEPVELRRALPVLPRELGGVLDAHPALLGAVDEEQAAERPPGLAAEVAAVLLVEQQHPLAGQRQLVGGHQAGQAGADDDHVGGEVGVHQRSSG